MLGLLGRLLLGDLLAQFAQLAEHAEVVVVQHLLVVDARAVVADLHGPLGRRWYDILDAEAPQRPIVHGHQSPLDAGDAMLRAKLVDLLLAGCRVEGRHGEQLDRHVGFLSEYRVYALGPFARRHAAVWPLAGAAPPLPPACAQPGPRWRAGLLAWCLGFI